MKPVRGAIVALAGLSAALCFAAQAGAATVTLGQIAPMGVTGSCSGCTGFQLATAPGSPSYMVPAGGPWTITSWSARGGATADSARLRVFRDTPFAGRVQLIAEGPETPIGVVEAPVTAVSIPVLPGDRIGLRTFGGAGDMPGRHPSASPNDQIAGVMGNMLLGETAGPGGTHVFGTSLSQLANVSATLTAPDPVAQAKTKKKCKRKRKKQGKRLAVAAKPKSSKRKQKKKCGKRKGKKKRS